ncbi:MAG: DUF58 domain-containing protein [Rhodothermaceae bacterium]|nr:DUF58 domain-containing protein [Rhodothermaceae bacterium]
MLVTPELLTKIGPLELKARQIVEGFISGLHKSPYYGFSVEFAEHRPYNPGDEIKHIDWKAYGKSERYYVKQYEEETNLRCYILFDISSSMNFRFAGPWSKRKYGAHFAAALIYLMHRQRDACSLVTFDQEAGPIIPAKSSYSHIRHLFSLLDPMANDGAEPEEGRRTASPEIIHELAERIKRRSLVIIISDLFQNTDRHDELISSLKHLRHRHHEVILFHMLEKKTEIDLDFPDKRFIFHDLETGEEIDVIPSQIKNDYKKKVAEYTHRFKLACSEAHIDYEEIDTTGPFDLGLLSYLNKRRRLG